MAIFADTRYEFWLDGEWLGRGPARFSQGVHEYDVFQINNLGEGAHVLGILAQWAPNTRRSESTTPGLRVQASGSLANGERVYFETDSSWQAILSDAWAYDSAPVHQWDLIGPTEVLDLAKLPSNWFSPGFNASDWPHARPASSTPRTGTPQNQTGEYKIEEEASSDAFGPTLEHTDSFSPTSTTPNQTADSPLYRPRSIPLLQETVITPSLVSLETTPNGSFVIDIPPRQQSRLTQRFSVSAPSTLELHWVNESHTITDVAFLNNMAITWTPSADHPDRFLAALDLLPGEYTLSFTDLFLNGLTVQVVLGEGINFPATPITQPAMSGRRALALDLPAAPSQTAPLSFPITFTASTGPAFVILDLDKVRLGRAKITISGPPGTIMDVGWDEGLNQRPLPYPGSLYPYWNQTDSWVLDGSQRVLQTIDARSGRYLYIVIWHITGLVTIDDIRVLEEHYPVQEIGSFHSSDPILDQIWRIGLETARLNMNDAYADPWRERGQWWGDAYIVDLTNRVSFGERGLLKRGLTQLAEAFLNGNLVGMAPNGGDANMRDYAMLWGLDLEAYGRLTGDTQFLREMFPALLSVNQQLQVNIADDMELLDIPTAHWAQTAYLDTWAGFGHSRDGVSAAVNAIYYEFLRQSANIATMVGEDELSQTWTDEASRVKDRINSRLLDSSDHYLATILQGEDLPATVFSQAWPLAYQITPGQSVSTAIANLKPLISPDPEVPNIGVYGLYWVAQAYANNGYLGDALDLIRLYYGSMIDRGATTWWERPDADQFYWAARSHGWGSWPTWFLSTHLLGAEWVGPNQWTFQPSFENVEFADGSIPVSSQTLTASWQLLDGCGSATARVESPAQTSGQVRFKRSTTKTISWNGRIVWTDGKSLNSDVHEEAGDILVQVSGAGEQIFALDRFCLNQPGMTRIFLPSIEGNQP